MGQIINFGKSNFKKEKLSLSDNLISLLPRLKGLKGETIVITISHNVLDDDELLLKLLREIVTIKCMEAKIIIIPNENNQINDFFKETVDISNILDDCNFVNTEKQADVLDVIFKRDATDKIVNILRSLNTMSIGVSGHNLDIIFPDEDVKYDAPVFDKPNKSIYSNGMSERERNGKKCSVGMITELLRTEIIPVISPTFKLKNGTIYAAESNLFGAFLASYLSSLKYVEIYSDEKMMPKNCVYGVEKFTKIIKTGSFNKDILRIVNAGIEGIKKGVQGVHIIDTEQVSLLEEFCRKTFVGLFLYDDILI